MTSERDEKALRSLVEHSKGFGTRQGESNVESLSEYLYSLTLFNDIMVSFSPH